MKTPRSFPLPGAKAAVLALLAGFACGAAPAQDEAALRARREPISPIPAPPAQNPDKVALGDLLFHDSRLSQNGDRACSTCHDTASNGATARRADAMPDGAPLPFNTPTIFNAALNFRFNWEGNLRAVEEPTERALKSPMLLAGAPDVVAGRLAADRDMAQRFRAAYGRDPDLAAITDALSAYERSLLTPGARFDRWLLGDDAALTARELEGYRLFKSLGCVSCHQGVNIGGNLLQRHGVFHPLGEQTPLLLRVPSLRNVAVTAPYFHDGSAATLQQAIRTMGYVQLDLDLADDQVADIAAFLQTLTGEYKGRALTPAAPAP